MTALIDTIETFRPAGLCVPPPSLEALDAMTITPDDVTLGEVYRAVASSKEELAADIADLRSTLQHVVYTDVFVAEKAAIRTEVARANERGDTARALALWSMGIMIAALVSGLVGVVVAIVK